MSISTSIGWPALAKHPRAPMRATIARLCRILLKAPADAAKPRISLPAPA